MNFAKRNKSVVDFLFILALFTPESFLWHYFLQYAILRYREPPFL